MSQTASFREGFVRPLTLTSPLFLLCSVVVVSSLLLGGGTQLGFLSDAILQLIALPLLLLTIWRLPDISLSTPAKWGVGFCLALAAVPVLQLIPLPPAVWTNLPNRSVSSQAFDLLGQSLPWMPLTSTPHRTWISALSLLVPVTIFLSVLLLSYRERCWLSLIILTVGTVSVFFGLAQVAQGPESWLRFYHFTNPDHAVGFFANRNHFAALCYVLLLFAGAWASNSIYSIATVGREQAASSMARAALWSTIIILLLSGEVMASSRAGLALTIMALLGTFMIAASDQRVGVGFTSKRLLGGALLFVTLLIVQFSLYRILERFEADPLDDWRLLFIPRTLEAAQAYLPLGSGLGSFEQVYALFERPEDAIENIFANHAHNDFVELWLETGIVGLILFGGFCLWFAKRSFDVWRASSSDASALDTALARAATLAVPLILVHSAVDYPLRTAAMSSIFALCCAFVVPPLRADGETTAKARTDVAQRDTIPNPDLGTSRAVPGEPAKTQKNLESAPDKARKPTRGRPAVPKPRDAGNGQSSTHPKTTKAPAVTQARLTPEAQTPKKKSARSAVEEAVEMARKRLHGSVEQTSGTKARPISGGELDQDPTNVRQAAPQRPTRRAPNVHEPMPTTVPADSPGATTKAPAKSQLPATKDLSISPVQIGGADQAVGPVKATSEERWGKDVEWPKEWRQTDETNQKE